MIRFVRPILAGIAAAVMVASMTAASTPYTQNVYRYTAFVTQATGYECTAAVALNIYNLAYGYSIHTAAEQASLYAYGRKHNAYAYAEPGVDPAGEAALLNDILHTTAWHWSRFTSMAAAFKYTATRMRVSGRPAVLFVGGGSHVWMMNGYTATADPHTTNLFSVTSVRFSGPMWPRYNPYSYGWFDIAPDTLKAESVLGTPFFRYSEPTAFGDYRYTPWNGYWVVVTA